MTRRRERLFSATALRLSFLSAFSNRDWDESTSAEYKQRKTRRSLCSYRREDEEKLLRALLLAQERDPSCSFAMKIYVQFNIE